VSDEEPDPLVDRVADVVFYAPLGLALEHRKLLPQLAGRGRRQVAFTRTIGQFTVRQGLIRAQALLEGLMGSTADGAPPHLPVVPPPAASPDGADPDTDPGPTASAAVLAIPQYDSLSAIQVVPRLEHLTDDELTQLREYETATRSRRTILAKISQLQQ
jgi:hypothetical protein